ncbi:MAG: hypothetical protein JWM02_3662 [Frankiales bacterium]|nr:hypothetical protein [Frankiales bacterium]
MSDAMTPVAIERKMIELVTTMTTAQRTLAAARNSETDAEIAYKKAKARAFHAPDCPRVLRGGVTTGERDAWIEERVENVWAAFKLASTQREIAQDGLRVTLAIAETVRSLGASVRTAYSLAGAS